MPAIDFTIEDTTIGLYNNMGKETITCNGKTVSEKFSLLGARHEFEIENNNYEIITSTDYLNSCKTTIQVKKNGKLTEEKTTPVDTLSAIIACLLLIVAVQFVFFYIF